MKKLFFYIAVASAALITVEKTVAQNANTSLSNLTAPTQINTGLLPNNSNAYSIGSASKSWKNIYIKGAVFLDGKRFIANDANYNTFIGGTAGHFNTGYYNTATGFEALYSNTSGSFNTSTGTECLYSNQTGNYNTASGYYAMGLNVSGDYNVATGFEALQYNTEGSYNTATGIYSLVNNTTGICNTGEGGYALYNNIGSYNTGLGYFALEKTTGAQYNTAVGFEAGDSYDNGYNNVFIGANVDVNGAGYYNDIAIGQGTLCTDVSQARFGNSATVSIGGYANWTNISDGRVKKNIKQNVPGLAFINKLQPITYNLDLDAADKIIQYQRKDSTGKIIPLTQVEQTARAAKGKILYTGFIAQDVEKAAKSLNYDFSGVDAAKNNKDLYGLRYAEFVVPLVKAVQELSKQNDSLKQVNNDLETKYENQQKEIDAVKSMISTAGGPEINSLQSAIISSPSLQQNVPNPFTNSTTISYSIPQKYSSAKIIITDKSGAAIKQVNLPAGRQGLSNSSPTGGSWKGAVNIDASTLSAGAYQYSLYVDGRLIDTKQMIATK